nr:RNA-dependent RNA polymerase [Nigrospora sphaerica fusarivirus 1]
MIIKTIFRIGLVAVATFFFCLITIIWPALVLAPVFFATSAWPFLALVCVSAFCPFMAFAGFLWVRSFVLNEAEHVRRVGVNQALWSVSSLSSRGPLVDSVVFFRESPSGGDMPLAFVDGFWEETSILYSKFILWAEGGMHSESVVGWAALLSFSLWVWFVRRFVLPLLWALGAVVAVVVATFLSAPIEVSTQLWWFSVTSLFYLTPPGWGHLRVRLEWSRLWLVHFMVHLALALTAANADLRRHYSEKLAGRRRPLAVHLRRQIMASVKFISNMRLPAFVRNRFQSIEGRPELERGRQILKDLGWPVNVDVADEPPKGDPLEFLPQYKEWLVSNTDWATGVRQMKLEIREGLADLALISEPYIRTEEYKTEINELKSTARYFQDRTVRFDVDVYDEVWRVVKPIFRGSRLTKFGDIIYLWEKKYALGFWMTDESGRRKLSRRSFIARVGYPAFKELWARTFVRASEIMPVSHVSVKDEALSPAKFLADKVRSIIGSPLSHYIGSTVFSHWPNHNFQFEATPIKIGMPLNGYWMGNVFNAHAKFQIHREGDFSSFDSTLEGPVKELIRAIRKRGYEDHKDHKRICDLIDVMYDQIDHQFLGHTSTGQVFRKGSGLTTGHSSTSMDNSLATVIFYLAAWKSLTGLGAREFMHFNELSCYGDDHMLSSSVLSPKSWTSSNIQKTMSKWGVVNNLEDKKLDNMSFLGKHSSKVTPELAAELKRCGVTNVTRAIWHDKARLVGKLTSKVKNPEPTYRARRLYSYLQLTAHHPEVYDAIVRELNKEFPAIVKKDFKGLPSYADVVRAWYRPSPPPGPNIALEEDSSLENDGRMVVMGAPTLLDHVLQALSVVPDLLNPSFFNYGPTRALTSMLSEHLRWVPSLFIESNGLAAFAALDFQMKRTPYAWIDSDLVQPQSIHDSLTDLLVRHWLFMLYLRLKPSFKGLALGKWALKKAGDLAFITRGQILSDLPRDFMPFDEVFVVAVLDIVHIPGGPLDFLKHFEWPDLASWLDVAWNRLLTFVWTSVPANFQEVDAVLGRLKHGESLLIEAPTGVGKSTALPAHLVLQQPLPHRKLIMIEPRSLLAIGLSAYVESTFGIHCSAATTGSHFDPRASIWFMTPQSFLGHLGIINKDDLIFIDEAHLAEPLMVMLTEMLPKWGFRVIMATATPTKAMADSSTFRIDVPIAQIFKVDVQRQEIRSPDDYMAEAMAIVNSLGPNVVALVVLDTPGQVDQAVSQSRLPAQGLSSRHDPVIKPFKRYFATNVVDVGVTIPGLDVIVSPNWSYLGNGQRVTLTEDTFKQRKGRVGRTGNGVCMLLQCSTAVFGEPANPTPVDAWRDAMAAGISPALGWALDPDSMTTLFGLDKLTPDQVKDFSRVSHIFLSNFRQLKAIELAQDNRVSPAGSPAVLVPAGLAGTFSSSAPQDLQAAHQQAISLASRLLQAIQAGDNVYGLLKEKLAQVRSGPLYRVSNMLVGLANDPSGWRPELKGHQTESSDPDFDAEIARIHELLDSLKRA